MTDIELGRLFGLFKAPILRDLISLGFPSSVAGSILKWFDPRNPEYCTRVSDWRGFLCQGVLPIESVPACFGHFLRQNYYPGHYILPGSDFFKIRQVHQVALLFYKAHAPARSRTDWDSVKSRLSNPPDISLTRADVRQMRRALRPVDELPLECVGRYGPGITQDGLSNLEKWDRKGFIPPVPPSWYRICLGDDWAPDGIAEDLRFTKVAEVPKTLKSNRIVSAEPAQSMYAQLLVGNHLDRLMHRAFAGHVYLHDQALHNSLLYSEYARTIDLSDASDYVSCDLVSWILPSLWPLLARVRSTHALFPDGDLVPLRTFAPMGSGVCFPVLTLVGLAISSLVSTTGLYHWYGDDGIVHVNDVVETTEAQRACGLKVNATKSCFHEYYRESCGLELLNGEDVTPSYIREPIERTDYAKLNGLVKKFNQLGWRSAVDTLMQLVEEALPYRVRIHPAYQRPELLVHTLIKRAREAKVDGWSGLRKWYVTRSNYSSRQESEVSWSSGNSLLVCRYRPMTDYPDLVAALDARH